jgi:DNA-binding transcriptional regulator YiaG
MTTTTTLPGAAFRAARIERNLSQRDVAIALGVTAMTVCNWERGRVKTGNLTALQSLKPCTELSHKGRPVGRNTAPFMPGHEVTAWRIATGATQGVVARTLGISQESWCRYERTGASKLVWYAMQAARADIEARAVQAA